MYTVSLVKLTVTRFYLLQASLHVDVLSLLNNGFGMSMLGIELSWAFHNPWVHALSLATKAFHNLAPGYLLSFSYSTST